jgi:hypothetical protein
MIKRLALLLLLCTSVAVADIDYGGPGLGTAGTYYTIDDTIVSSYYHSKTGDHPYLYNVSIVVEFMDSCVIQAAVYGQGPDSSRWARSKPDTLWDTGHKTHTDTAIMQFVGITPLVEDRHYYVSFWVNH